MQKYDIKQLKFLMIRFYMTYIGKKCDKRLNGCMDTPTKESGVSIFVVLEATIFPKRIVIFEYRNADAVEGAIDAIYYL